MNYVTIVIVISSLLLQGCLDYSKQSLSELTNSSSYTIITHYEQISQEEASLLGLFCLPYAVEQLIYKKNDSIYGVDSLYIGNLILFKKSYELLKEMYIASGWTLHEEVESDSYVHVFLKKVDKEIVLFIEEKEVYSKNTKKKEIHVFVHQSLLIV